MKDELIKERLLKDLGQISSDNFNDKIISQLLTERKKKKIVLFKEGQIVSLFMVTFFFVAAFNLDLFPNLNQTEILIGSIISMAPIFLMVYNKIYQSIT